MHDWESHITEDNAEKGSLAKNGKASAQKLDNPKKGGAETFLVWGTSFPSTRWTSHSQPSQRSTSWLQTMSTANSTVLEYNEEGDLVFLVAVTLGLIPESNFVNVGVFCSLPYPCCGTLRADSQEEKIWQSVRFLQFFFVLIVLSGGAGSAKLSRMMLITMCLFLAICICTPHSAWMRSRGEKFSHAQWGLLSAFFRFSSASLENRSSWSPSPRSGFLILL